MIRSYYEKSVLGYPITVTLSQEGPDWLVKITGGCAPHIGSISVGYWENGSVMVRKILLPEHRDDVVSDLFAETLARRLQANITAVCGIHYNSPSREDLVQIVSCTKKLLEDILCEMDPEYII